MSSTITRAGIIGDVHSESNALAATLTFLQSQDDIDTLLCTGDIPDTHRMSETQQCCELLAATGVQTIRGNHDRWFAEEMLEATQVLSLLNHLPVTRSFETQRGKMLLCHGLGGDDMAGIYPGGSDSEIITVLQQKDLDHYRFLVAGHTHQRMVRSVGHTTIINPGTLLHDQSPGFLIADFFTCNVQFYDVSPFNYAITKAKTFTLPTE